MNKTRAQVLCLLLVCASIYSQTQCDIPKSVRVGFFNGVNNDWAATEASRNKLSAAYGPTAKNGASVSYELYYNPTQGLRDFVETFGQRLAEQDVSLNDKFYLFFEAVRGGGDLTDAIMSAAPELGGIFQSLFDYAATKTVSSLLATTALVGDVSNIEPNTFAVHARQMDEVAKADERLLIVAHSQGNLFANKAFNYFKSKASTDSVRAIHVGPASPILHGEWTIANLDLVITAREQTKRC